MSGRLLDLAEEAGFDWRSGRVLDPAAGGGAFLEPAALKMRESVAGAEPAFLLAQIATRLTGFEIDENAACLAQASLELALADLVLASGRPVPPIVQVCDALEEAPAPGFDLVVGNPPYGRVTLTADQRDRFGRGLYGHANLYGVFTDLALRWAKPGGFVAYLTPTSFLSGRYYSALRSLLASEAPPVAFDFVHARQGVFEDVLQETMLAVYRKSRARGRAQVHYLHVSSEQSASATKYGTVSLPASASEPWLAPRSPEHGALIARAESMPSRLRDWGYGVSTGPLVWNRFRSQLRDSSAGRSVHPLVWAESVTVDGRFIFRARKKNHAPYFELRPQDRWLLVTDACVLVQRTTAKGQPRRVVAAELPSAFVREHGGVVVENHLNMIRATGRPKVATGIVAALFNSRVVDQLFRCMNGSVAVSAFELEALPLPSPETLGTLCRARGRPRRLHRGRRLSGAGAKPGPHRRDGVGADRAGEAGQAEPRVRTL